MDINAIKIERQKWLLRKNIVPMREALKSLKEVDATVKIGDCIEIECAIDDVTIERIAKTMIPWRKGPFKINGVFIDSEWQSFLKYNLLKPHFNLAGKVVADIGCNNGYYMFRMLEQNPKELVGFDPSAQNLTQFEFINRFVKSNIVFEMLGVEHLPFYEKKFDVVFCLGVLYHRSDPIATLKALKQSLNKGGELILDTFMIDGEDEVALTPKERYSRMRNVYFIPTINALKNWCYRAGFAKVEVLAQVVTSEDEQRATPWIAGQSLEYFLDKEDKSKTVEGYPAPKRAYIKAFVD
jgi:tRNA (mo5U34)-methyltransferase